jgi:hypothetical protein
MDQSGIWRVDEPFSPGTLGETVVTDLQELGLTLDSKPAFPSARHCQFAPTGTTLGGVLDLGGEKADWVMEAAKKLEAIGRLRAGWDSYGGSELDPEVKTFVVVVLQWLGRENLPVPAVVLCSPGTVQLEWRARGGKELEVELKQGGAIEFVKVSSKGNVEGGVAESNVRNELRNLTIWLRHG